MYAMYAKATIYTFRYYRGGDEKQEKEGSPVSSPALLLVMYLYKYSVV
jgi:hypothetical protein